MAAPSAIAPNGPAPGPPSIAATAPPTPSSLQLASSARKGGRGGGGIRNSGGGPGPPHSSWPQSRSRSNISHINDDGDDDHHHTAPLTPAWAGLECPTGGHRGALVPGGCSPGRTDD
uniref:(northern house mosquito) hypothetical protein n=1 Tax=Culex pipiens TaxID=7175 RepID=A0A8D8L213_CULPI